MSESQQHVLGRVRRPRVQITYDVETGGAIEKKHLPFVIGILSDLFGNTESDLTLAQRKFISIDRDNFNHVMQALAPSLTFQVANKTMSDESESEDGEKSEEDAEKSAPQPLGVQLKFENIDDFHPEKLILQIEPLKKLYEARVRLVDLMSKIDGNDALYGALSTLLSDEEAIAKVAGEVDADETPEINLLIDNAGMIKDESQRSLACQSIQEFLRQKTLYGDIKDLNAFIAHAISQIDRTLSAQLDEVMHHPQFQKLEGSWRGLKYLVFHAETGQTLKLRLLPLTRHELLNDLERAVEFDQSQLFKKIYEDEYGVFGGQPFSCLIGDFEFGRHPQDVELLRLISGVASSAHAPFIAASSPKLFDLNHFSDLSKPRDLAKIFDSSEMIKWNSLRETEDARYIVLTLPRVLLRNAYGPDTIPVQAFNYQESVEGELNDKFCWGNPAYILGERIAKAFSLHGWTAAIRGVEGGGLVENLPIYTFKSSRGDIIAKTPVEVLITDRREKELSDLGFIALCPCKGKDYAAFFGGQAIQKPKTYNLDTANANALLSCRLPYLMNASRFAHYVKVMLRDKIGSFASRGDIEQYLQTWIADYILLSDVAPQKIKAQYPLREAKITVVDVPGQPGAYKAVMFLRPHFQLEELTASIRLVAELPTS